MKRKCLDFPLACIPLDNLLYVGYAPGGQDYTHNLQIKLSWTLAPDFCQRLHCKFDQTQLQLACSRDDRLNHRAHNGLSQHHCYRTNICPKFTPSSCLCQ